MGWSFLLFHMSVVRTRQGTPQRDLHTRIAAAPSAPKEQSRDRDISVPWADLVCKLELCSGSQASPSRGEQEAE